MANTITNTRTVASERKIIQYVCIDSDGTEETDLVVYDSSAVATVLGISDPLNCTITTVRYTTNSAVGVVHLEFDANTDVLAHALSYGGNPTNMNYNDIGGLKNTGSTGKTGDITLTTTGLAAGDKLTLILEVRPI